MVYIDAYPGLDINLCPQEGESYQDFKTRCLEGIRTLMPAMSVEDSLKVVNDAWAHHLFRTANELTVRLKRDLITSAAYSDSWWTDWYIDEVVSATTPSMVYSVVEKNKQEANGSFRIAKTAEEKQLVFGWANVAKDAEGNFPLDWDGDATTPEELEEAAYRFVLKYRAMGEKHEGEVVAHLVESTVFTKEKQQAMGIPEGILPEGWWTGFYIPDKEVFAKVKSGEYEMLSVQGKAQRLPIVQ